jgi:hypothetical protein
VARLSGGGVDVLSGSTAADPAVGREGEVVLRGNKRPPQRVHHSQTRSARGRAPIVVRSIIHFRSDCVWTPSTRARPQSDPPLSPPLPPPLFPGRAHHACGHHERVQQVCAPLQQERQTLHQRVLGRPNRGDRLQAGRGGEGGGAHNAATRASLRLPRRLRTSTSRRRADCGVTGPIARCPRERRAADSRELDSLTRSARRRGNTQDASLDQRRSFAAAGARR